MHVNGHSAQAGKQEMGKLLSERQLLIINQDIKQRNAPYLRPALLGIKNRKRLIVMYMYSKVTVRFQVTR